MNKACGIIVLYGNKVLLCHPTNSRWEGTFGVPKGRIDYEDEETVDCATREFFEETGILVDKKLLNSNIIIPYADKKGIIYKELHLFVYKINDLSEIGLTTEVVPTSQLQLEEIDWCGFLDKEEAITKMFAKQIAVLDFL